MPENALVFYTCVIITDGSSDKMSGAENLIQMNIETENCLSFTVQPSKMAS